MPPTRPLLPAAILPLLAVLAAAPPPARADAAPRRQLTLTRVDTEPPGGREVPGAAELTRLAGAVSAAPGDRAARFALVKGLMNAGQLEEALVAARAWRAVDAYNLVVVRMVGDIESALGHTRRARRAYSAVVELLPEDPGAQRALAGVLKQAGDLVGARDRLAAALKLEPKDRRIAFELADVDSRLGHLEQARQGFEAIAGDADVPDAVRTPARQRLAQVDHQLARAARAAGQGQRADQIDRAIAALDLPGGSENDVKVFLTWDTDKSDVDLWVTNPAGEKVFYGHKQGRFGGALYDDVTTGYGPESFTATAAEDGEYLVQVNYYGIGRSNFSEARGEVVVLLHEGQPDEQRHVLPYRLFKPGQTVTVARIHVNRATAQGGTR